MEYKATFKIIEYRCFGYSLKELSLKVMMYIVRSVSNYIWSALASGQSQTAQIIHLHLAAVGRTGADHDTKAQN